MKDKDMISGILLAITLIEGAANATAMIASIRSKLDEARQNGQAVSLHDLASLQESNQSLTQDVLDLLEG